MFRDSPDLRGLSSRREAQPWTSRWVGHHSLLHLFVLQVAWKLYLYVWFCLLFVVLDIWPPGWEIFVQNSDGSFNSLPDIFYVRINLPPVRLPFNFDLRVTCLYQLLCPGGAHDDGPEEAAAADEHAHAQGRASPWGIHEIQVSEFSSVLLDRHCSVRMLKDEPVP